MSPSPEDGDQKNILTYFSHSYRPEQKHTNLRIWEILSDYGMKFLVDPKTDAPQPMGIPEIEFMMRRSACFVAVVPYRKELEGGCSPYQLFENRLAIRARKPSLLLASSKLLKSTFPRRLGVVKAFKDSRDWFDTHEEDLRGIVKTLSAQARETAPPDAEFVGPVGLLLGEDDLYRNLRDEIAEITARNRFGELKDIDLTTYRDTSQLLNKLEKYSVIITDVRPPHIPLDLLATIHGRAIPMLRLCHLRGNERSSSLESAMGLRRSSKPVGITAARKRRLPLIFSGYKLDDDMQPILFWRDRKELPSVLGPPLQRLREKVDRTGFHEIDGMQAAREYFLQLGRVPGKVFISNPSELNPFVKQLTPALDEEGIGYFHYRVTGNLETGSPNYKDDLEHAIKNSALFIALIDENYSRSEPCQEELKFARDQYRKGQLLLRPYMLQEGVEPPVDLGLMHRTSLHELKDEQRFKTIVADTVKGLEIEQRLILRHDEQAALDRGLAELASRPRSSSRLLLDLGFPKGLADDLDPEDIGELRGRLLTAARRSLPEANALGRLAYRCAATAKQDGDRKHLAGLVSRHRLLPDLRASVPRRRHQETGLGYYAGDKWFVFRDLERGVVQDPQGVDGSTAPEKNYVAELVNAAGDSENWESELVRFGKELGGHPVFDGLRGEVDALIHKTGLGEQDIGVCFAADPGLALPLEWAIEADQQSLLCLRHPVRRFLSGMGTPRPSLRSKLLGQSPVPLKVLLISANTGDIPQADEEVEVLAGLFGDWFRELGWPRDTNLTVLSPKQATPNQIKKEITAGGHDLLHIAGHGASEDDQPGIALPRGRSKRSFTFVSDEKLHGWIARSELSFVYLGCCHGAAPGVEASSLMLRRFDSVAQAVVRARVPEVVGFLWPVDDLDVKDFAREFYRSFLQDFRASSALLEARRPFEHSQQIIASPVLYSQIDTETT